MEYKIFCSILIATFVEFGKLQRSLVYAAETRDTCFTKGYEKGFQDGFKASCRSLGNEKCLEKNMKNSIDREKIINEEIRTVSNNEDRHNKETNEFEKPTDGSGSVESSGEYLDLNAGDLNKKENNNLIKINKINNSLIVDKTSTLSVGEESSGAEREKIRKENVVKEDIENSVIKESIDDEVSAGNVEEIGSGEEREIDENISLSEDFSGKRENEKDDEASGRETLSKSTKANKTKFELKHNNHEKKKTNHDKNDTHGQKHDDHEGKKNNPDTKNGDKTDEHNDMVKKCHGLKKKIDDFSSTTDDEDLLKSQKLNEKCRKILEDENLIRHKPDHETKKKEKHKPDVKDAKNNGSVDKNLEGKNGQSKEDVDLSGFENEAVDSGGNDIKTHEKTYSHDNNVKKDKNQDKNSDGENSLRTDDGKSLDSSGNYDGKEIVLGAKDKDKESGDVLSENSDKEKGSKKNNEKKLFSDENDEKDKDSSGKDDEKQEDSSGSGDKKEGFIKDDSKKEKDSGKNHGEKGDYSGNSDDKKLDSNVSVDEEKNFLSRNDDRKKDSKVIDGGKKMNSSGNVDEKEDDLSGNGAEGGMTSDANNDSNYMNTTKNDGGDNSKDITNMREEDKDLNKNPTSAETIQRTTKPLNLGERNIIEKVDVEKMNKKKIEVVNEGEELGRDYFLKKSHESCKLIIQFTDKFQYHVF